MQENNNYFRYRKSFIILLLSVLRLNWCQSAKSDALLLKMEELLRDAYLNDTTLVNCMIQRMQADKMVTELYKAAASGKKRDIAKMENYLQSVEFRCVNPSILLTPLGLGALLSLVIVLFAFVVSVIKSIAK